MACSCRFIQINSGAIKNTKIQIFKDENFNYYYVSLNFRLFCNHTTKLNDILKTLGMQGNEFKNGSSFTKKFIKKHTFILPFPHNNGKIIIKHLINLNEKESESEEKQIIKTPKKKVIKEPIKKELTEEEPKIKKKKKKKSDASGSSNTSESNSDESSESVEIFKGLVPIMLIPCYTFNIDDAENKSEYFVQHYKSCHKCNYTNNNSIELGNVINNSNFEYLEIIDEMDGYFNPALDCYLFAQNYEPIDNLKYPFIRLLNINNDHPIYNKCILICWIIE
jgi:hypothetical protein